MVCQTMPCSSIHSNVSCGGQYPRNPTCTKCVPGTAPDSISRAHRRAVAGQVPVDDVRSVGVGVEVDDADIAVTVHVGHRGRRRPRDRMIAAENDGHDPARCDGRHPFLYVLVRHLGLPVWTERVAEVDHLEPVEDLQSEIQVIRPGFVRGGPDRPRTEARTRAVGGRDVEGSADDRDVRPPGVELFGFGQERPVAERRQPGVRQIELLNHAWR